MSLSGHGWAEGSVEARVERAIGEVRPALQADGGDVELVSIEGDLVRVRLTGACSRCAMAGNTLEEFIQERVLLWAPEIREVVRV